MSKHDLELSNLGLSSFMSILDQGEGEISVTRTKIEILKTEYAELESKLGYEQKAADEKSRIAPTSIGIKQERVDAAVEKFKKYLIRRAISSELDLTGVSEADFEATANEKARSYLSQLLQAEEIKKKHGLDKNIQTSRTYVATILNAYLAGILPKKEGSQRYIDTLNRIVEALSPQETQISIPSDVSRTPAQLKIDAEDNLSAMMNTKQLEKVLLFLNHMAEIKPSLPRSQRSGSSPRKPTPTRTWLKSELDNIASDIRMKDKKSFLVTLIESCQPTEADTPQTCAQRILQNYFKEKLSPKSRSKAEREIQKFFNPSTGDSKAIKKFDTTWQEGCPAELRKAIVRIANLTGQFLANNQSHLLTTSQSLQDKYEMLTGLIMGNQKQKQYRKVLGKFINTQIFVAIKDPQAILEYLRLVLIKCFVKPGAIAEADTQSFSNWLNSTLFDTSSGVGSAQKQQAQAALDLQELLLQAKLGHNQRSRILNLFGLFGQHYQNPTQLYQEINAAMRNGVFGTDSFYGILQQQSQDAKEDTTHPRCTYAHSAAQAIPASLPLYEQSILRLALKQGSDDDVANIVNSNSAAAADIAALKNNPHAAVNDPILKQMIEDEPLPAEQDTGVVNESQLISQALMAKQELITNAEAEVKQWKTTQQDLLILLRQQVLFAVLHYQRAKKNGLFHGATGLVEAETLLFSLCDSTTDLRQGIEHLQIFLNEQHNLRDDSFTTYLLAQLYSQNGGLLHEFSQLQTQSTSSKRIMLKTLADKAANKFQSEKNTLTALLNQSTLNIGLNNLQHRAQLMSLYNSYDGAHRDQLAADIIDHNSWKNGLWGRNTLFGMSNKRRDCEADAINKLNHIVYGIKGG